MPAISEETFNLFVPLTKIDEEKRLVYGLVTAEQPDRVKEVCHYESTKPYFEKWSQDIAKASNGKSLGNLRAMHGTVAAGKLIDIFFDDDKKQIEICAKVVDDSEWNKVIEGVHTGFSQGGKYVKRWKDAGSGYTYYTAEPTEVSLVDVPCLPSATFEIMKRDGAHEKHVFKTVVEEPTHEAIKAEAERLAKESGKTWRELVDPALDELLQRAQAEAFEKAVGAVDLEKRDFTQAQRDKAEASGAAMEGGGYPIQTLQDLKNAIQAFGRAKDKAKTKAHIISRAKALGATKELPEDWTTKIVDPAGLNKFEPIVKYDCGCAEHAHLEKTEAVECMRKTALETEVGATLAPAREAIAALEKVVAGEELVAKAAPQAQSKDDDGDGDNDSTDPADAHDDAAKAHDAAAEHHAGVAADSNTSDGTQKHLAAAKAHARAADGHRAAADMHRRKPGSDGANDASKKADFLTDHATEKSSGAFGKAWTLVDLEKTETSDLQKGMYHVARLASMIEQLKWLCESVEEEAEREGDGSGLPAKIKAAATELGACLVEMAGEEVGELFTAEGNAELPEPANYEMAAHFDAVNALSKRDVRFEPLAKAFATLDDGLLAELRKMGARNSAADADRLQKCHDIMKEMGATCAPEETKSAEIEDLRKNFDERETLFKGQIETLTKAIEGLTAKVAEMAKRAAPARAAIFAVSKDVDSGAQTGEQMGEDKIVAALEKMTPDEVSALLMKDALRKPFAPSWG